MERCAKQKGITLIEVLVTLVILSVGMLALAKIQLIASAGTNSAGQRNQAVMIADNILENMRVNKKAALNGQYNISFGQEPNNGSSIVQKDLYNWKQDLKKLINGQGSIQIIGARAVVIVRWDDNSNQEVNRDTKQQIKIYSQL